MAKQRRFFWCHNDRCRGWLLGKGRRVLSDCAQELGGKRLCQDCFDAGFRLKTGIICQRKKAKET